MTTPNRPPLWREMQEAGDEAASAAVLNFDGFAIAAEIRALRDWIKKARPNYDSVLHGVIRADELDSILALLTTEADRAERSDTSTSSTHW